MNPFVSVVTPAYNTEKYISECIDSIQNQSYTHFEHIIVNDGSTDNTARIVQSYQDSRIKLISHDQNMGLAHARNTGIENANGEYIAWLDADDVAESDRLQEQVMHLTDNKKVSVCGSWSTHIGEGKDKSVIIKPLSHEEIGNEILFECPFVISSTMVRKSVYEIERYVTEDNNTMTDYDMWCRLYPDYRMENLPGTLTHYRVHSEQMMSTIQKNEFRQLFGISVTHLLKRLNLSPEHGDLDAHYHLVYACAGDLSTEEAKQVVRWGHRLISANNYSALFPVLAFRDEVSLRLERFIHRVEGNLPELRRSYLLSKLLSPHTAGIRSRLSLMKQLVLN